MAGDERLERYRLNVEKCLALAQTFNDHQSKRTLIEMANTWLKLAEQHLKNSETTLVYETPTPRLKASDNDLK
jgi:hypothetical protein